jgi:hypothetical protein
MVCLHKKSLMLFEGFLKVNGTLMMKLDKMTRVPHSKSGIVPRSSLSGAGQLGFWEIGKGGTFG